MHYQARALPGVAILTGRTWAQVRKNRVAMKTFVLSEVDPADVPYLDAAREKQRRKTLARKLAAGTDAASMKAKRVREREVKAGMILALHGIRCLGPRT